MNGVHDMGGMHGLGAVEIEKNEPVFHNEWEARTFALTLAAGYLGKWNLDMSRFAREQMPGPEYLATSYYEHWLYGLCKLLVDQGLVTAKELESGRREAKASEARVLRATDVPAALRSRIVARMEDDVLAKFRPGDRVVARNIHTAIYTRSLRYARRPRGFIQSDPRVF